MTPPIPWARAWVRASRDFWAGHEPGEHFHTSAGPALAERVVRIVEETDARLGHPDDFTVIDVGCGDGELLRRVRERVNAPLAQRARWIGVDMREVALPGVLSVAAEMPADLPGMPFCGVVMAHEWLDEIPCDIVERGADGVDRVVLVDARGQEMLGPALGDDVACAALGLDAPAMRDWVGRWWRLREPGDRAEIGLARDRAWAWMGGLLEAGLALATDYGHDAAERHDRYRHGTLTAYRRGRIVRATPDGSAGLTAHVAWDSCTEALPGTVLSWQRDEIARATLPGEPDPAEVAHYFDTLRLRDPSRLGGVGWLRWEC